MKRIQQWFLIIVLTEFHHVRGLVLQNISVPLVIDYRQRATLSCSYEMGKHQLNSVKWYKDKEEFFRYSPMVEPDIMTFDVPGVTIANRNHMYCNKVSCRIELDRLQQKSSGAYRCEVSGDAPEFKLISKTANMTVAALSQLDPFIIGLAPRYKFNDFISTNCTSDWSSPPATLAWYINGVRAAPDLLQPQQETTRNQDGFIMHSRSLELRFYLDRARFKNLNRILEMKCVASIAKLPIQPKYSFVEVQILSDDELHNQKLVKGNSSAILWNNSVSQLFISSSLVILRSYFNTMFGSSFTTLSRS